MIPDPNINRIPQGLLGFLGIKNGGRNPRSLSDVLSPTWPADELYFGTNALTAAFQYNAGGVNFTAAFVVPQNEAWYVQQFGVFTDILVAGQEARVTPAMVDSGGLVTVQLEPDQAVTALPGDRAQTAITRNLVLMPGDSIGCLYTRFAAGALITYCSIRYAPMQI